MPSIQRRTLSTPPLRGEDDLRKGHGASSGEDPQRAADVSGATSCKSIGYLSVFVPKLNLGIC
jgi:hypothetical protein